MATDKDDQITQTEQNILNKSQDTTFKVLVTEILGYNPTASTLNRVKVNSSGELVAVTTPADNVEGAPVTVGTTAVEITFTGTTRVINLKAASTNTGLIWFGPSNVTNTGANAYGELTADSSVEIELNDASSALYVISDTAAQKVYKVALT